MKLILLLVCFAVAFWFSKTKRLPVNSFKPLNSFIIYLALPAISLKYIPNIAWNHAYIFPILMPILLWFGSYLFLKILSLFVAIDKPTFGALWILIGLSNTSFLGFPLTSAYFGEEGLEIAVLCDQISFVIVSTLGLWVALKYSNSDKELEYNLLVKKMLSFPAFICFILALAFPDFIKSLHIEALVDPLAISLLPLAFFSIGLQMGENQFDVSSLKINLISLSYKLVLAPAILLFVGYFWVKPMLNLQVTILEAAMAPMVTGVLISNEYKLNVKLSNSVLGLGILLSFPTTYIWQYILKLLA